MRERRTARATIALVVIVTFLVAGCAGVMQSSGQAALVCGAGGAAVGAAVGGAASRNWQGALIGAAAGALVAGLSCFAVAEYRSRQVRDYQQTREATGYQPGLGDVVRITNYEITPAAAAPGTEVVFNATYEVMTANPEADVVVTETRVLRQFDPATQTFRELGRIPNQVTVKPGTRQADGKFQVRSGVGEGRYEIVFHVAREQAADTRALALLVSRDPTVLNTPAFRTAQANIPGAKPVAAPTPVAAAAPVAPDPGPTSGTVATGLVPASRPAGAPLSALGEPNVTAPAAPASSTAQAPAVALARTTYFVATRVAGRGNLRSGPGTRHPVVGMIGQGERYVIVDRANNPDDQAPWYRLRLENGSEAWVAGSLGVETQD